MEGNIKDRQRYELCSKCVRSALEKKKDIRMHTILERKDEAIKTAIKRKRKWENIMAKDGQTCGGCPYALEHLIITQNAEEFENAL